MASIAKVVTATLAMQLWEEGRLDLDEEMTPQYPDVSEETSIGLFADELDGRRIWSHEGGEYGASTETFFGPEKGMGAIVLTNGEDANPEAVVGRCPGLGGGWC